MKKTLIILIAFVMVLSGCARSNKDKTAQGDIYEIYSVKENALVASEYVTETKDCDALLLELLAQLGLVKESDNARRIIVDSQSVNNQVAYLSFNKEYMIMDNVTEVLNRAAIVRTITQIPEIAYVYFYVDGNPLTYSNDEIVGKMAAADFVDETNDDINSLAWITMVLYFSNVNGDSLVPVSIDAAYSKTMSIERLVLEQLIAGPDKDTDMKATLPSGLKVLGVSVKDGICYVNLDGTFLNEIVDVSANIQIYSIVNSLAELPNINSVQIQVNGDSNNYLRDVSLEKIFEYNQDIVVQTEVGSD